MQTVALCNRWIKEGNWARLWFIGQHEDTAECHVGSGAGVWLGMAWLQSSDKPPSASNNLQPGLAWAHCRSVVIAADAQSHLHLLYSCTL